MITRRFSGPCLALAAVVAGCGGTSPEPSEPPSPAASAASTTPSPPVVRSAEHDARDAGAEDRYSEPDGTPIAPEPQGVEPNRGTPGVQDATGGKIDVSIRDRRFAARVVRAKVGQIIVFTNDDDVPHTVRRVNSGLPRSGLIPAGGRFEYTPLEPGRVRYRCIIHPRTKGALVVRPQ